MIYKHRSMRQFNMTRPLSAGHSTQTGTWKTERSGQQAPKQLCSRDEKAAQTRTILDITRAHQACATHLKLARKAMPRLAARRFISGNIITIGVAAAGAGVVSLLSPTGPAPRPHRDDGACHSHETAWTASTRINKRRTASSPLRFFSVSSLLPVPGVASPEMYRSANARGVQQTPPPPPSALPKWASWCLLRHRSVASRLWENNRGYH